MKDTTLITIATTPMSDGDWAIAKMHENGYTTHTSSIGSGLVLILFMCLLFSSAGRSKK